MNDRPDHDPDQPRTDGVVDGDDTALAGALLDEVPSAGADFWARVDASLEQIADGGETAAPVVRLTHMNERSSRPSPASRIAAVAAAVMLIGALALFAFNVGGGSTTDSGPADGSGTSAPFISTDTTIDLDGASFPEASFHDGSAEGTPPTTEGAMSAVDVLDPIDYSAVLPFDQPPFGCTFTVFDENGANAITLLDASSDQAVVVIDGTATRLTPDRTAPQLEETQVSTRFRADDVDIRVTYEGETLVNDGESLSWHGGLQIVIGNSGSTTSDGELSCALSAAVLDAG